MNAFRMMGGLALGSALILGACTGQDRATNARANQARPGTPVMQDPLNAGSPGVGNPDRIGGPGMASGATAVPGSAGGGGTGIRNQGYGAPVR